METIRKSAIQDCKAIYLLICEMEEKELSSSHFETIYNKQLEDSNHICLVYEKDSSVIGCINIRMEYQLHHAERICEIMELSVNKKNRSNGIGKKLFNAACDEAKQMGCTQIEVNSNQLRERTHKFYAERGIHNFHYKLSLNFAAEGNIGNQLGR